MLSDRHIKMAMEQGAITFAPEVSSQQIQPVSVDLRLGDILEDFAAPLGLGAHWRMERDGFYMLQPQEFILGSTLEHVSVSRGVAGFVHGKSTWARQGLIVHAAGLVDPGFSGQLTLEMYNMSRFPVTLEHGMMVCQISFSLLSMSPDRAYGDEGLGSKYQGQTGPTPARFR